MLVTHCLSKGLGVIPSPVGTGEPWFDVDAIEGITGVSRKTVMNKVSESGIEKHPAFSSYVHLSDFERIDHEENQEA